MSFRRDIGVWISKFDLKFIFEMEKRTRIEIEIQFGYERVKYFVWTCYVQQRSEIGKMTN